MQCKFSVFVYNSVTCVCTALKSDYDVTVSGKHICNLTLTFIAPVCTNYCFYHVFVLLC